MRYRIREKVRTKCLACKYTQSLLRLCALRSGVEHTFFIENKDGYKTVEPY